jgi:hypothetical protein
LASYLPLIVAGGAALVLVLAVWALSRRRRPQSVIAPTPVVVLPGVEQPAPRRRLARGTSAPGAASSQIRRKPLRPTHARR